MIHDSNLLRFVKRIALLRRWDSERTVWSFFEWVHHSSGCFHLHDLNGCCTSRCNQVGAELFAQTGCSEYPILLWTPMQATLLWTPVRHQLKFLLRTPDEAASSVEKSCIQNNELMQLKSAKPEQNRSRLFGPVSYGVGPTSGAI